MSRIALCLIFVASVAGGCDKGESKPNPEMKVPDVPPGGGARVGPKNQAPKP